MKNSLTTGEGQREEERLEDATAELEEANILVAKSQQQVADARAKATALQKMERKSCEEELAIIKLKESIQELTDAQDGSREKELELILAKEELNELIAESTSQSDAYFDAVKKLNKLRRI